ncbi:MAG: 16S rRNA (guanine(966)-N(2))-methyltransferase RsmD [Candidatus Omnitrophica bacterium]|nr:16S rRNA (guanine(966)-N(2))-methyltransferase RsmD [Candidatus Omnitrophota bacterium]
MRIISGRFKSQKIFFPKTHQTRPVTDRAKETIFNVLGSLPEGALVLDLFAGSGSLGLEALSRGASTACFVDQALFSTSCIKRNLDKLRLNHVGFVIKSPVQQAIRNLIKQEKSFNLIFLDPPHNKGLIKKILHQLDHSDIVPPLGIIVVGHSNQEGLPQDLETLCNQRSIKIGQTFVSFLAKKEER